jgi:hypothetical protein
MKISQFATLTGAIAGLLLPQLTRGQSITYLSNTNQAVAGTNTIFPELGVQFQTGPNPKGYTFNDVQLSMGNAKGNPTGSLIVSVYYPSTSIGGPSSFTDALSGSTNPTTAGIYIYTATSNITLAPETVYYIQVEIGGSDPDYYEWNYTSTTNAVSMGGWIFTGTNQYNIREPFSPTPILAIDATPIVGPTLDITTSGMDVILSWPESAGNFALQSTLDLTTTNWAVISNIPVVIGQNFVVTNAISDSAQYFRLQSD